MKFINPIKTSFRLEKDLRSQAEKIIESGRTKYKNWSELCEDGVREIVKKNKHLIKKKK